jgi:ABC-2 type transport system permease protein
VSTTSQTVWRICRRECTELVRDRRLALTAGALFLVLAASTGLGAQRFRAARTQVNAVREAERRRWLEQGEKHPHSAAHQGVWAFRPSGSLSVFDPGVTSYVGSGVHLEAHSQRLFRHRPAEDGTWVTAAGELTAAVTLQRVVPMLLILAGFGVLAGDRERGTLRLALSTGTSPRVLAAGKALGLLAPLTLVLVPASALGAAALVLYGSVDEPQPLLRVALLAAGYLAYFLVVLALTLAVSARAATSRQALATLTLVWLFGAVLCPPLALGIIARHDPTPTAFEFATGVQSARAYGPLFHERLMAVEERLLQQHGVRTLQELPVNATGVAMFEEEADEDRLHDVHFRALHDAYARQDRSFQLAALASPVLAVQSLSMGLSGSSLAHHLRFAGAAEEYRRGFVQSMNDDIARNDTPAARRQSNLIGVKDAVYLRGPELWESVPDFAYVPPGLGWLARQNAAAATILGGWTIAALALAARTLRRFAVEPS